MSEILAGVRKYLKNPTKQTGMTTIKIRSISSKIFNTIENKDIYHILNLSEQLLKENNWAFGVIAYDWAYKVRKQYNGRIFEIFEGWLFKYVSGWGSCDDFCTHAFGNLFMQKNEFFPRIINWTEHEKFCVRRAAAVILIYSIKYVDPKFNTN